MKTLILAGLLSLITSGAIAHSPLEQTEPADAATIALVPESVSLTFKKDIRLTRVTSKHASADAVALDLGDQKSFRTMFVLPLLDQGSGAYVIEWRGLGDDGHALQGEFRFDVE